MGGVRYMIDPAGQLIETDEANYDSNRFFGYTDASPQQIADAQAARAYKEKYGGWRGTVMALDYAAANALTLGLSDVAGAAMNPSFAEDRQGFREVNPGADLAGSALGFGLGLGLPAGGPALASKAGKATREGVLMAGKTGKLAKTAEETGGFTFRPLSGEFPSEGFAYATNKGTEKVVGNYILKKDIAGFAREHVDELLRGDSLGAWKADSGPNIGKYVLDLTHVSPSRVEALREAAKASQDAVFDLKNFRSIPVNKATLAEAEATQEAITSARGTVQEALKKALAVGAGSAVEAAAYGTGQVVSEYALGDPDLMGEIALSRIGASALIGGTLGFGASAAWNLGRNAFQEGVKSKLTEWLAKEEGVLLLRQSAGKSGAGKAAVRRWVSHYDDVGDVGKMAREGRELGILSGRATAETIWKRASARVTEFTDDVASLIKEADVALADDKMVAAQSVIMKARNRISGPMLNHAESRAESAAAKRFNGYLDSLEVKAGDRFGVSHLWDMRQYADDQMQWGKANAFQGYSSAMHKWRGLLDDEIEGMLGTIRAPRGTVNARASYHDLVHKLHVSKRLSELAEIGATASATDPLVGMASQVLGLAGGAGGALAGMAAGAMGLGHGIAGGLAAAGLAEVGRRYGAGLGADAAAAARGLLESGAPLAPAALATVARAGTAAASAGAAKLISDAGRDGALRGLVDETANRVASERRVTHMDPSMPAPVNSEGVEILNAPEKVSVLAELERTRKAVLDQIDHGARRLVRGTASVSATAGMQRSLKEEPERALKTYEKRVRLVQRVMSDPERMQQILADSTEDWFDHAPSIATALNVGSVRAISFLASKIPRHDPPGPLARELPPTRDQMGRFGRYWEAVEKPLDALKQAQGGALTQETVEAVRYVYPMLWAEFQKSAISHIAENKRTIPYQRRLMIGKLLDADVDGSLRGDALSGYQATYAMMSQRVGATQPNRSQADKPVTTGQRSRTTTSAAAARDEERRR